MRYRSSARLACPQGLPALVTGCCTWLGLVLALGQFAPAQDRHARVSPVLEIEILDPGVDPRGNPAVVLSEPVAGVQQVELPPSLIVHRYYYTGDRSFRGPDMPGGPCVVVVHHPKSGEQLYLPVQMLPGSPIVKYCARSIEYDFGDHAVIISFPHLGDPVVSYRNGRPVTEKLATVTGASHLMRGVEKAGEVAQQAKQRGKLAVAATHNAADDVLRPLTLPVKNLARLLPGHAALSDPALEARVVEQTALRQREAEVRRAAREQALSEVEIPRGF